MHHIQTTYLFCILHPLELSDKSTICIQNHKYDWLKYLQNCFLWFLKLSIDTKKGNFWHSEWLVPSIIFNKFWWKEPLELSRNQTFHQTYQTDNLKQQIIVVVSALVLSFASTQYSLGLFYLSVSVSSSFIPGLCGIMLCQSRPGLGISRIGPKSRCLPVSGTVIDFNQSR